MSSLLTPIQRLLTPKKSIPFGFYHFHSPHNDQRNYHLHLRIDETGDGLLIINASTILHLNKTAAEYAYHLVHSSPEEVVARQMTAQYQVNEEQARQDYKELAERIRTLIEIPDLDPVTFLDFERRQPFSGRLSAPYRLDCALTYRLPDDESKTSAPLDRVDRELSTAEWKKIFEKAWDAGIPHILMTGGEPTLRDDLYELIRHTEKLGQVSGLLTDGLRLSDATFLDKLLQSGLDHLMLILKPSNEMSWQAVNNVMIEDLSVTVHHTITENIQDQSEIILRRLVDLGVKRISLSAVASSLIQPLLAARSWAAALGLELVWNLPAPYSDLHPIALEVDDASMEGAGRAWIYVEPDGDTRPAQGNPKVLGNMLTDPWDKIWKS